MGLFDKIKDNAKTISIKAIESTEQLDDDSLQLQTEAAEAGAATAIVDTDTAEEESQAEVEATSESNQSEIEEKSEEEEEQPKAPEPKEKEEKSDEKPTRKSKITEVPKSEVDKSNSSYTPHYKSASKSNKNSSKQSSVSKKDSNHGSKSTIIDIAPKKQEDTAKKTVYARERAAMSALSTKRKLEGAVPLYSTTHMKFTVRVFIDRVEYSGSFGRTVVPAQNIAWLKLRHGGTGIIIETTENKRVVVVVKPADRLSFANAVMKVQSMVPKTGHKIDNNTIRIDQLEKFSEGVDEIEKLARLFDKGIITQEEFDAKKKQILGI